MTTMPIAGQPLDVPSSRRLRKPWPMPENALARWSEELAEDAAAALEDIDRDTADELIAALVAHLAASYVDAHLRATRTRPVHWFERRLCKSVDTFNRQFG